MQTSRNLEPRRQDDRLKAVCVFNAFPSAKNLPIGRR
jgi:hypothetical protein